MILHYEARTNQLFRLPTEFISVEEVILHYEARTNQLFRLPTEFISVEEVIFTT